MSLAQQFMSLFAGLDRAHGFYQIFGVQSPSGKMDGKGRTKREPITETLWQLHLDGKQMVGVVPIRDDSTCVFGAIDIDAYKDFDPAEMARKCAKMELPVVVCRSKSGGAHLYLFAKEPVAAGHMQDRLRDIAAALGLGKRTEIFPVQRVIDPVSGDIGNWINMPYYDMENTVRPGYSRAGEPLPPDEFIRTAIAARQPESFFKALFTTPHAVKAEGKLPPVLTDRWFPEGPPCLQQLGAEGVPEGMRNHTLLNMGIYYKTSNPDYWREKVKEINQTIFDPPLDAEDIQTSIFRSLSRRTYKYSCNTEPMLSRCNSAACRGRRYGVGRDGKKGTGTPKEGAVEEEGELPDSFPIIGGLRRIMTRPPKWFLDIDDIPVQLDTEDLQLPVRFQRHMMASVKHMAALPTPQSWNKFINDLFAKSIDIEVDEPDMIWQEIEAFCRKYSGMVSSRAAVRSGMVWTERDKMWFQLRYLLRHLKVNRLGDYSEADLQAILKGEGIPQETWIIEGANVYVWGVPEYSKFEEDLKAAPEGAIL